MPILAVKNLSVTIDKKTIIENLSFTIDEGDILAIIGPNGSGKTVLIKTLLGMYPYIGTITWGTNIRLGYVPQKIEADRHLPLTTKNLLYAKQQLFRLPLKDVKKIIADTEMTNDLLETPIGHLSGGQFQKALIAFALLGQPNMLIFDEPTASIDVSGENEIYNLIHKLEEQYKFTTILISHDLSVVYHYATKVFCLNRKGLCYGPPTEVLTTAMLEKLYGTTHKYHHHDA